MNLIRIYTYVHCTPAREFNFHLMFRFIVAVERAAALNVGQAVLFINVRKRKTNNEKNLLLLMFCYFFCRKEHAAMHAAFPFVLDKQEPLLLYFLTPTAAFNWKAIVLFLEELSLICWKGQRCSVSWVTRILLYFNFPLLFFMFADNCIHKTPGALVKYRKGCGRRCCWLNLGLSSAIRPGGREWKNMKDVLIMADSQSKFKLGYSAERSRSVWIL